ncbi:MAG: hypothetical protein AAB474_00155 [Patescibacteria group bacterium]
MFNKSLAVILIIFFALPLTLLAEVYLVPPNTDTPITTEVVAKFEKFNTNFIGFLQWLFPIMLSASAILAVVMLIFAGFKWMAGAISPPEVDAAKKMIAAAIGGLALALSSWLILNTINPNLVKLQEPRVNVPSTIQLSTVALDKSICLDIKNTAVMMQNIAGCSQIGGSLARPDLVGFQTSDKCQKENERLFVCLDFRKESKK